VWPDDRPDQYNKSLGLVPRAFFQAGLQNPALFYVLLWSTCAHQDVLRRSNTLTTSSHGLSYKIKGIQKLNEALSKGGKNSATDAIILTVLGLVIGEDYQFTEELRKPFNPALTDSALLSFHGRSHIIPEHLDAIVRLVALRGGIDKITLPGLAESLIM